jgi:hypothetical protein
LLFPLLSLFSFLLLLLSFWTACSLQTNNN